MLFIFYLSLFIHLSLFITEVFTVRMLAEEVSMINIAEAVVMIESVEMTSEFFIFHLSLFTIRVFAVRTLVEEIRLISTVRVIRAV